MSETKPWNVHYTAHQDWRLHSDPILYYKVRGCTRDADIDALQQRILQPETRP